MLLRFYCLDVFFRTLCVFETIIIPRIFFGNFHWTPLCVWNHYAFKILMSQYFLQGPLCVWNHYTRKMLPQWRLLPSKVAKALKKKIYLSDFVIRRSVRSCSQTIPEALAKFWRAASSKFKAFGYMVRKLRSIAFQRCTWRGGPPLVEMAENEEFLEKKAWKTAFKSIAILDQLTSERAGTPNFKSLAILGIFHEKCGP